jgi:hopanoid-associated phosphorylase
VTILAATGLQREARILAGAGIEVIAGGGDHARLEVALEQRARSASGIISIGIAGALAPQLRPGQWVVADSVHDGTDRLPTHSGWTRRLQAALPAPATGTLLGANTMVAEASAKAALHRRTGAIAVDMESHVAARVARRHALPFAVARVISDAANRTLPPAARVGMRPDGDMDLPAVLRSLLTNPLQLPALVRTGLEAEQAFRALLRGHRRLGAAMLASVVDLDPA